MDIRLYNIKGKLANPQLHQICIQACPIFLFLILVKIFLSKFHMDDLTIREGELAGFTLIDEHLIKDDITQ